MEPQHLSFLRLMLSQPNYPPSPIANAGNLPELPPELKALVEKPVFTCTRCWKRTMYFEELKAHIAWDHMAWLPYKCLYCYSVAPTMFSMMLHMNESHTHVEPFKVEYTANDHNFNMLFCDLKCAWHVLLKELGLQPQPPFGPHQNHNVVLPPINCIIPPLPAAEASRPQTRGGITPHPGYSVPMSPGNEAFHSRPPVWQASAPSLVAMGTNFMNEQRSFQNQPVPVVGPSPTVPPPMGTIGSLRPMEQPEFLYHGSKCSTFTPASSGGDFPPAFSSAGQTATACSYSSSSYVPTTTTPCAVPRRRKKATMEKKGQQPKRRKAANRQKHSNLGHFDAGDIPVHSSLNYPPWSPTMASAAAADFSLVNTLAASSPSLTSENVNTTAECYPAITVSPESESPAPVQTLVPSEMKPGFFSCEEQANGPAHKTQQVPNDHVSPHSESSLEVKNESFNDGAGCNTNENGIFFNSGYLRNVSPVSPANEEHLEDIGYAQDAQVQPQTEGICENTSATTPDGLKNHNNSSPVTFEIPNTDIQAIVEPLETSHIEGVKCEELSGLEVEPDKDHSVDKSIDSFSEKVKTENDSASLPSFGCAVVPENLPDSILQSFTDGAKLEQDDEFPSLFNNEEDEDSFQVTSDIDRASRKRKMKGKGHQKMCPGCC